MFLHEATSQFCRPLTHDNVRWLSHGHVHHSFVKDLTDIRHLMEVKKQKHLQLYNHKWLTALIFFSGSQPTLINSTQTFSVTE